MMDSKERLLSALSGMKTDRPPVICPGGMMNAAVVDIMTKTGHAFPAAHHKADLMAELAVDVRQHSGFENMALPFCMTIEAEILGSAINFGSLSVEPKIEKEAYSSVSEVPTTKNTEDLLGSGRVDVLLGAIRTVSRISPSVPVTAAVTGPVSTCTSIVDPATFYKELRKKPEDAQRVIDYVSDLLCGLARLMVNAGATVIVIADPSASGEILGPNLFERVAVPALHKIVHAIHALNTPVIVHICGDMKSVKQFLPSIKADAISTDAMVNLGRLKAEFPSISTMGNMSTYLLEFGPEKKIVRTAEKLIREGIDIIAPACGLSTSTPLPHIHAFTEKIKAYTP